MTLQRRSRRPDESMTLLTEMLQRPLDPGYAAAAERRRGAGLPPATSLRSPLALLAALVVGLVLGLSASALEAQATTKSKAKAELVARIEDKQAVVTQRTRRLAALRTEATGLERALLERSDGNAARRLLMLTAAAGGTEVGGPGFVVTLDDAPTATRGSADGNPRTSTGDNEGVVMAKDVQVVTNGLWGAGAEAISINGQRLTSTSSIRFAGDAILVDFRPLTRPYVITAIGDPGSLPAAFAEGPGGTYAATLKDTLGLQVTQAVKAHVTIPASATLATRFAVPLRAATPAASSTQTGGTP